MERLSDMKRLSDWHPRLCAWLTEVRTAQFAYGSHDCALFAAGAVAAMTGEDPAQAWRGHYTTLRGGLRKLRADGYRDHVALAADMFREIAPGAARPGDLATVPGPDGLALGVVQGEHVYALQETGLALVPVDSATRAFAV